MPAIHFTIRWPDSSIDQCYSPSRAIQEYLEVGAHYAVPDFVERCRSALHLASERVRAKYGYACSSALDQFDQIERKAARFAGAAGAMVRIERFTQ